MKNREMSERRVMTFSDFQNEKRNSDDSDNENMFDPGQNTGVLLHGDPNLNADQRIVGEILDRARATTKSMEEYSASSGEENSTVSKTIYFWRDGFSIEDGPLYRYSEPENQKILHSISNGRAPTSLFNVGYEQPIDIRAVKCMHKDYTPQKRTNESSSGGAGQTIGSASTNNRTNIGETSGTRKNDKPNLSKSIASEIDELQPVTIIKVQLWEGTRVTIKINANRTIGYLYEIVDGMMPPERVNTEYTLETLFPVRVLNDRNMTIEEASVKGSVLIQQFT